MLLLTLPEYSLTIVKLVVQLLPSTSFFIRVERVPRLFQNHPVESGHRLCNALRPSAEKIHFFFANSQYLSTNLSA